MEWYLRPEHKFCMNLKNIFSPSQVICHCLLLLTLSVSCIYMSVYISFPLGYFSITIFPTQK